MKLGPISEWVTAIAEILAVCVALFLPLLNTHHENKKRQIKFKFTVRRLTSEALKGHSEAIRELKSFVNIGFFICDNDKDTEILVTAAKISSILSNNEQLSPEQTAQVKQLIANLN